MAVVSTQPFAGRNPKETLVILENGPRVPVGKTMLEAIGSISDFGLLCQECRAKTEKSNAKEGSRSHGSLLVLGLVFTSVNVGNCLQGQGVWISIATSGVDGWPTSLPSAKKLGPIDGQIALYATLTAIRDFSCKSSLGVGGFGRMSDNRQSNLFKVLALAPLYHTKADSHANRYQSLCRSTVC